ncbi:MAG: DUF2500 domain-containing protein [Clostridia bacterium]|nr:DUF2500 domain-containing protein [Clostridia bacterium]
MNEALTLAFTMLGGGMAAILILILLAKLTSKINVEEKQGRKPVYNIQAEVKGKRTLIEADPENPNVPKTRYFITFHKRDGNRVEMEVPGEDFGLAAEDDEGVLVYSKGDEFIVFKRM